jgi:hypothetical protein
MRISWNEVLLFHLISIFHIYLQIPYRVRTKTQLVLLGTSRPTPKVTPNVIFNLRLPHEKLRAPIIPWPSSQRHKSLINSSVRAPQTFFCCLNASILACLSRKSLIRNPSPAMASQAPANTYTLPTSLHNATSEPGRKTWRHRLNLLTSRTGSQEERSDNGLRQTNTNASARSRHVPKWWKIRLFRGMIGDVRRRAPFYWSDWTDAWDYRVVPATIYMYFAKYVLFPSFLIQKQGKKV